MTLETVPRYEPGSVTQGSGRAVVVGGSVAGMLAARVLADRYASVVVLDRDRLPDEPVARTGVPQSVQPHGLLEGGRATIEDLLPGYSEAVLEAGGVEVDTGSEIEFYDDGVRLTSSSTDRSMVCASRPLFELVVRRRLERVDAVDLREGCAVLEYCHDADAGTITGVRVRDATGETTTIEADLVVDATGRTSRTPAWLAEHGYPEPSLDEVHIDVLYGTVELERPAGNRRTVFLPASYPHRRGALVVPVEDGRWIVNLHGLHGDHPPGDLEGFRRYAEGLANPVVADLLADATFRSDAVDRYPVPSSRRYRYEDLDDFPAGLLVVGDAIASFNPIYAQGMTVAAFEALSLHHVLADGDDDLATRFFEASTEVVEVAWSMSVGPDLEFPETEGPRPTGSRIAGWYVSRLQRRGRHDPVLTEALSRVIHFEAPPSSLFRPGVLWRVLSPLHGWARRSTDGSEHGGIPTASRED